MSYCQILGIAQPLYFKNHIFHFDKQTDTCQFQQEFFNLFILAICNLNLGVHFFCRKISNTFFFFFNQPNIPLCTTLLHSYQKSCRLWGSSDMKTYQLKSVVALLSPIGWFGRLKTIPSLSSIIVLNIPLSKKQKQYTCKIQKSGGGGGGGTKFSYMSTSDGSVLLADSSYSSH